MNSHTSLVAQQTRLSEWAEMIRNCQNRPQGMTIDEWCQMHDITKASYYWRLRKVREAVLETAKQTQTFVEVPSSAIHPVSETAEYKIAAVIRGKNNHRIVHNPGFCQTLKQPSYLMIHMSDTGIISNLRLPHQLWINRPCGRIKNPAGPLQFPGVLPVSQCGCP